jgi:hypothetical protein
VRRLDHNVDVSSALMVILGTRNPISTGAFRSYRVPVVLFF